MLLQLKNTLEIISNINKTDFVKNKINQNTLNEQKHNLYDLKILLDKYSDVIKKIKNKDHVNRDNLTFFIVEVHATLLDLKWHIDEIDDLLRTFSKSLSKENS